MVFRDWALRSAETSAMVLEQRVFVEGSDEVPLLRMTIQRINNDGRAGEAGKLWTVLRIPLSVLLQTGLQFSIDDAEPMSIAFHHCQLTGCFAFLPLTPGLRSNLETGTEARVIFHTLDGRSVSVPVSLFGIKAGIRALEQTTLK